MGNDSNRLTPEEQEAFEQLLADYKEFAAVFVPNYPGGLSTLIAHELIKAGWRKT